MKFSRICFVVIFLFVFFQTVSIARDFVSNYISTKKTEKIDEVKTQLTKSLIKDGDRPEELAVDGNKYKVEYTFNEELQSYIEKLLRRHRSDYTSIVVIDNATGEILSIADSARKEKIKGLPLAFSSTHPSASIFKIVTTAELLENTHISKNSLFKFRGRSTTLYKYQLKDTQSRWNRSLTLKQAFAWSNNVIFGKAAIQNIKASSFMKMASNLGFNKPIMSDVNPGVSIFEMPKDQYNLAELASGLNRKTMMSPLHGAVLASIIANDGVYKEPTIYSTIKDEEHGFEWLPEVREKKVLSSVVTQDLRELMENTVVNGTARGVFKRGRDKNFKFFDIGGKTGTITGGIPHGKRDWFVSYAVPKDEKYGKGISICAMIVNKEKWYVKSTFLTKSIIDFYRKKVLALSDKKNVAVNAQ